jgi:hypothetical protein
MTPELVLALGLMSVDYAQTMQIARNPNEYHEMNPILGKHPSPIKTTLYFASAAVVTYEINQTKYGKYHTYFMVGMESAVVAHNFKIGLKLTF